MQTYQTEIKKLAEQYPSDNEYPYPMVQIPVKDLETFVGSLLQAREEWLRGEIMKLETPKEDVACDHGDHIDRDDVLSLLTPKNTSCPSPENPCMCECHPSEECYECKMGRHKPKIVTPKN